MVGVGEQGNANAIAQGGLKTGSVRWVCKEHGQTVVVYCKQCELHLCGACLINHKNHNYLNLKEIEAELVPKTKLKYELGERCLKGFEGQRDALMMHIKDIRSAQEQREGVICNYLENVRRLALRRHRDMMQEEDDAIACYMQVSIKLQAQIAQTVRELHDCKEKLRSLLAPDPSARLWKALELIADHTTYSFEGPSVQAQAPNLDVVKMSGRMAKVLEELTPEPSGMGSDKYLMAVLAENEVLRANMEALKLELATMSHKCQELVLRTEQFKGRFAIAS